MSAEIQKLYIAYFNRPADPGGLAYWTDQLAKGATMTTIANSFSASAEYQAIYAGKSNLVLIDQLYQNLFGRTADVGGLLFWSNEMLAGRVTITTVASALASGTTAGSADNIAINSKIAAASAFTAAIDTAPELLAYSGSAATAQASAWLSTVTTAATLATAIAPATLAAAVASSVASSTVSTGSTFTLTTNSDNFTGTSGNDTFIGDAATITTADQVNGGAGTADTIKIYSLAAATDIPTLSDVEIVELFDSAAPANALDLSGVTAMTTLRLSNATTTDNYTIGAAVAVQLDGMADAETVTLTSTATDTTHDLTITNMGTIAGAGVTVNADGAAITTINISVSGTVAAGTDSDITLASTGTESTVNVSGSGALAISALNASVTTLNAGTHTGPLTAVMGAATAASTITTGSGADTVTATAAVDYTINLGDGNDTLTTADAAGELTIADTINGGNGTDVLSIVSAEAATLDDSTTADAAVLAKITNFERLRISDAVGANLDLTALGYNYFSVTTALAADRTLTVASNFTIESRLAAAQANDYIISMTGANAAGSNSDTINIVMNADLTENDALTASFDLAGINIVNIASQDRGDTAADTDGLGDEGYTIDLAGATATNSASIKTVNITGTQAVSYTVNAATTSLETIDASGNAATATGLGGIVTVVATAYAGLQGLVIKGGAGRDVLTGSTLNDAITGGAGNDTINGGVGADVLTGSAGTDTFALTAAASFTGGTPSATVFEEITDYAKGVDIIDETVAAMTLSTDASQTTVNAATASISLTTGIATFNAADDTLAERIAAVNAGLAAGTEATNQIAIFEFSGSTYVYIYDNTADTVDAADGLIKLTGVTGITASDLTTSTGNLILS